jgi:FtsP/CotA-like multicopper oxidase with cupredoxin domain
MWNIDRRCINDEDDKVIVDLPSGERVEITFDGNNPVIQLFTIDNFPIEMVEAK